MEDSNLQNAAIYSEVSKFLINLTSESQMLQAIFNALLDGLNNGDSCLYLSQIATTTNLTQETIVQVLKSSSQVHTTVFVDPKLKAKPFTLFLDENALSKSILYITRYAFYETSFAILAHNFAQKLELSPHYLGLLKGLESNKNNFPNQLQYQALSVSLSHRFSIITGGPGTGKTTTIALLLMLLLSQTNLSRCKIKLAAPTGKAVARLKESISNQLKFLEATQDLDTANLRHFLDRGDVFATLHRLLKPKNNSIYFTHNQSNYLDVEVLIIDEASMIGLPLFYKLFSAINPAQIKHIILLGDANQLSSVEEGYVFANLIKMPMPNLAVTKLLQSNRNTQDVGVFATAILNQQTQEVQNLLAKSNSVKLKPANFNLLIKEMFIEGEGSFYSYAQAISHLDKVDAGLFKIFNQFKILCQTNNGVFGVDNINNAIEIKIKEIIKEDGVWYSGRPIMILENDYTKGLYNGDVGIAMRELDGSYIVCFEDQSAYPHEILPKYKVAYALTIHKTQGSEFDAVAVVLNDYAQSLLSNELIYTAVTRAKTGVTLYGSMEGIISAIERKIQRLSALPLFRHPGLK